MAKKQKQQFTPTQQQTILCKAVMAATAAIVKVTTGVLAAKDGNGWTSIAKALHGGIPAPYLKESTMGYKDLNEQAQAIVRKSLSVYANAMKYGVPVFGSDGDVLGRTGIETAYKATDAYAKDHAKEPTTPTGIGEPGTEGAGEGSSGKSAEGHERDMVLEGLGIMQASPEMRADDAVLELFAKVAALVSKDRADKLAAGVATKARTETRKVRTERIAAENAARLESARVALEQAAATGNIAAVQVA